MSVGNHIWIAWDDTILDVNVIELGDQFVHCRVTVRALHTNVIITVVYSANEIAERCELW